MQQCCKIFNVFLVILGYYLLRVTEGFSIKVFILWKFQKSYFESYHHKTTSLTSEAVVRRCSSKQVFLKISEISQGNTCIRASLLKKTPQYRCFLWNFRNFQVHIFLQNTSFGFFCNLPQDWQKMSNSCFQN